MTKYFCNIIVFYLQNSSKESCNGTNALATVAARLNHLTPVKPLSNQQKAFVSTHRCFLIRNLEKVNFASLSKFVMCTECPIFRPRYFLTILNELCFIGANIERAPQTSCEGRCHTKCCCAQPSSTASAASFLDTADGSLLPTLHQDEAAGPSSGESRDD